MNDATSTDRVRGVIFATIFHVALLLILILIKLGSSPAPKTEAGILINFGTDEFGQGRLEPATDIKVTAAQPKP